MVTTTATIRWPDGGEASATIVSGHPNDEAGVVYSGAVDRLSERPSTSFASLLPIAFEDLARRTGGTVQVVQTGRWPDENDAR